MKKIKSQKNNNNAFTILFAVIVSSLILALGLGIVAITMKEVKLSGAGRDSQLAFYAADSGLECAQYFDLVQSAFGTSTDSSIVNIKCNNKTVVVSQVGTFEANSATSKFEMFMEYTDDVGVVAKPCADVIVTKSIVTDNGVSKQKTTIDSRGYNTCDPANTRRLERGYRVEY